MDNLPKGALCKTDFEAVGICHKMTLTYKTRYGATRSTFIMSAENAGEQSQQLHPNKRALFASMTSGGIENTRRVLNNCGFHLLARKAFDKRSRLYPPVFRLADESMERKRRAISQQAIANKRYIVHRSKKIAAVIAHSDGCGAKRSYGQFFTGEGIFVAVMVGHDVVAAKFLQNNGRADVRNLKGTVSVGEVLAVKELAECLATGTPFYKNQEETIADRTKLHISQLAADGDTKVVSGLKKVQKKLGLPGASKVAVICHEIKNLGKAIMKAKKSALKGTGGLDVGRSKAIGKDVRDCIGRCGAQLAPLLSAKRHREIKEKKQLQTKPSRKRKREKEQEGGDCDHDYDDGEAHDDDDDDVDFEKKITVITSEYIAKKLPQIISHHCGICEDCDPDFCRLKRLMNENAKKPRIDQRSEASLKHEYLTQRTEDAEGNMKRSRFRNFLKLDEQQKRALLKILGKRYTDNSLRNLALMLDNNNCERLWTRLVVKNGGKRLNVCQGEFGRIILSLVVLENNEGLSCYNELEKRLELTTFASCAAEREQLMAKRQRDSQRRATPEAQQKRRDRRVDGHGILL